MGQCTSKNEGGASGASGTFNQMKKSDRQLRSGVKFKDIEFGGFIGYSTIVNDVYTPSGVNGVNGVNGVKDEEAKALADCENREAPAEPTAGRYENEPLIPK